MEQLNLSRQDHRLRILSIVAGMVIAVLCAWVSFRSSDRNELLPPARARSVSTLDLSLVMDASRVATVFALQPEWLAPIE